MSLGTLDSVPHAFDVKGYHIDIVDPHQITSFLHSLAANPRLLLNLIVVIEYDYIPDMLLEVIWMIQHDTNKYKEFKKLVWYNVVILASQKDQYKYMRKMGHLCMICENYELYNNATIKLFDRLREIKIILMILNDETLQVFNEKALVRLLASFLVS